MIKIKFLDERELMIKKEIETIILMIPKANNTQMLSDKIYVSGGTQN